MGGLPVSISKEYERFDSSFRENSLEKTEILKFYSSDVWHQINQANYKNLVTRESILKLDSFTIGSTTLAEFPS